MTSLTWKYNRLRVMSVTEIGFRVWRSIRAKSEKTGIWPEPQIPPYTVAPSAMDTWLDMSATLNAPDYLGAADRICSGTVEIFGLAIPHFDAPFRWNTDLRSGITAPMDFGKTLDYRRPEQVGDIKWVWEANRHLHLVTLAQAYRISGELRYLQTLAAHLDSWFRQCPYALGPNWASALEPAMRLINWSAVWSFIGGATSPLFQLADYPDLRKRWMDSVYLHVHFIRGHFSEHSSANNHLIGELAGVWVATQSWPYWANFSAWSNVAQYRLEIEALKQHAPDGVNREQAVAYQQFVVDLLLICGLVARKARRDFSAAYWSRLESALSFFVAIIDSDGHLPMIGDGDDALVLRLNQAPDWDCYRSLLATGAILFERADFKFKAKTLDDKTRCLLGAHADADFAALPVLPAPAASQFRDGGYYVLGCDFDTATEMRIVIDAGPLGYESIAAHGHADALAFTLSLGGREFLIDPGTYAYHTERLWRDYFRGTSAHNTVRVDGLDQSTAGGNFLWIKHAHAWCEAVDADDACIQRFIGAHDGYRRLGDPVTHRRSFTLDVPARAVTLVDSFDCARTHVYEGFFHFSEHCMVSLHHTTILATNGDKQMEIELDPRIGEIDLFRGNELLPAGWISRRFAQKVPTWTLRWRYVGAGDTRLLSVLRQIR